MRLSVLGPPMHIPVTDIRLCSRTLIACSPRKAVVDELTVLQIQLTLREDRFQEIRMELGHVWVTCVGGSRRLRPAPIKGVMGRRALRLVMAGQLS